jgi:transposase-like protein
LYCIKKLLDELLEKIMLSERDVYLEKDNKDKGNGFYDRTLATSIGKLELSVPRTKNGDFRPKFLPELY